MDTRQAKSDERDNNRVFVWGICAAVLVLLGALAYFYAVDKRGEAPSVDAPAQAAPAQR